MYKKYRGCYIIKEVISRCGKGSVMTNKRVFTLRLSDEVFDKIGYLAPREHRSMTNYIEFVLIQHLQQVEREKGPISLDEKEE